MRPPICDVCGDDFDPSEGALVSCQPTEAASSSVERPEMPGTVGHPPNQGWFCPRHVELAERLAPTTTLRRLIHVVRRNDDIQTCEVCGERFDTRTVGGMCSFQSTPAGRDFHMARIRNEEVGLHPDSAWICHAHIDPALRIKALTKSAAIAELTPPGRAPYAYDERPPSTPPDLDEHSPPIRGPFRPVADDDFEQVAVEWHDIAPHPVESARQLVFRSVKHIAAVFGTGTPRSGGSTSTGAVDPLDLQWSPSDTVTGISWAPHQVADITIFRISLGFWRGSRSGPLIGGVSRLLIQRRQQSVYDVAFVPGESPTYAADGELMVERVRVRRHPDLEPQVSSSLDDIVDGWIADMRLDAFDPLDPAPDLIDVDLGTGSIVRNRWAPGESSVSWRAGESLSYIRQAFVELLPDFLAALGVEEVVELTGTKRRHWSPMDGATPPHCPFSDEWRWEGEAGGVEVSVSATSAHWDERSVSNTSANLRVSIDSERAIRLSFHQRLDGDDHAPTLSLARPTTPAVVATVRDVFDC